MREAEGRLADTNAKTVHYHRVCKWHNVVPRVWRVHQQDCWVDSCPALWRDWGGVHGRCHSCFSCPRQLHLESWTLFLVARGTQASWIFWKMTSGAFPQSLVTVSPEKYRVTDSYLETTSCIRRVSWVRQWIQNMRQSTEFWRLSTCFWPPTFAFSGFLLVATMGDRRFSVVRCVTSTLCGRVVLCSHVECGHYFSAQHLEMVNAGFFTF